MGGCTSSENMEWGKHENPSQGFTYIFNILKEISRRYSQYLIFSRKYWNLCSIFFNLLGISFRYETENVKFQSQPNGLFDS